MCRFLQILLYTLVEQRELFYSTSPVYKFPPCFNRRMLLGASYIEYMVYATIGYWIDNMFWQKTEENSKNISLKHKGSIIRSASQIVVSIIIFISNFEKKETLKEVRCLTLSSSISQLFFWIMTNNFGSIDSEIFQSQQQMPHIEQLMMDERFQFPKFEWSK